MDLGAILVLALGLSLDALAVSVALACGLGARLRPSDLWKLGGFFGGFQALMPLLGGLAGRGVRGFVAEVDHWIAFGLLAVIGGKMVVESFRARREECVARPLTPVLMLTLAVATSIDALAAGFGISLLGVPLLLPAAVIGATTASLSVGGALLAVRLERYLRGNAELVGGLALVAIGLRIVAEHLG